MENVSDQVCVYVLDPSRSRKVASEHFGSKAEGILNVDRYAAYKRLGGKIKRALCWYHYPRNMIIREKSIKTA